MYYVPNLPLLNVLENVALLRPVLFARPGACVYAHTGVCVSVSGQEV